MSFNGSGTFQINSAGQPVVTNTTISSTAFNDLTADLATGLTTALCKDGQSTTTANIPFAQGLTVDTVGEYTLNAGVTVDGVLVKDSGATVQDTVSYVVNTTDTTKKLKLDCSGITTATTRTLTVPDADTTIVGADATQTLTNKTISGSSNTLTNLPGADLTANSVANSSLAQMAANTIKGNNTGATANAADLSIAQVLAMLGLTNTSTLINVQGFGTSGTYSKTSGATKALVFCAGPGGGGGAGDQTGTNGSSGSASTAFGTHCSASAGGGGLHGQQTNGIPGTRGTATGGTINITGGAGNGGAGGILYSGSGLNSVGSDGGPGGLSIAWITSSLGATETVTVGTGGAGGTGSGGGNANAGSDGWVLVLEFA